VGAPPYGGDPGGGDVSTLGVVGAIVVLVASIMLHEAGHFLTAKHYGMKATRFFLGFGPTIWSFHRGETEYGVKAIPAGGFVKIVGMTPLEEFEPGDENRAFYRQPARQRAVVLSAGSVVHIVIALLLTYFVLVFCGDLASTRSAVYVASVPKCVIAADVKRTACQPGDPASPAQGQLQKGDRILAVNGKPLTNSTRLRDQLHVGSPVTLDVLRHGQRVAVTIVPIPISQKEKGAETIVPRIGVLLDDQPDPPHVGALAAIPKTGATMGEYLSETVQGLGRIPATLGDVLSGKQRGPQDVGSVVGAARISGQVAGASQIPLKVRIGEFFLLMAGLNFFIGVFNMLPLLPLDGGHVAILAFEEGRSRLYRLIGRPDPGRVDLNKVMAVTYAVFVLIVAMSAILLYADIFRPIKLNG
jgi:membrane-associated protease RseP (regulator of RpoE activity)